MRAAIAAGLLAASLMAEPMPFGRSIAVASVRSDDAYEAYTRGYEWQLVGEHDPPPR